MWRYGWELLSIYVCLIFMTKQRVFKHTRLRGLAFSIIWLDDSSIGVSFSSICYNLISMRVYVWACMFPFPWQGEGFQTYTLKHTRLQTCIFLSFVWWSSVYVWVCMFHFPWQAEGFQTYTLKHTRFKPIIFDSFMMIKRVCLSVYVWFSLQNRGFSNIHAYANLHFLIFFIMIKRVCLSVYVSFSMTGRGFSNIHTCSAHSFIFWNMRFWACMFERVCLIFDDRQSVFKHTYMLIRWLLIVFVGDFA